MVKKLRYDEEIGNVFDIKINENKCIVLLEEGKEFSGRLELVYESGEIYSEGNIEKGVKEGVWKTFYETGELKVLEYYEKGLRENEYNEYYQNGKKSVEIYHKNGIYNGSYKTFYETGNEWLVANYKDGNIFSKYNMEHGKENGIKKIYYKKNTEFNGIKSFNTPLENAQLYKKVKMKNSLKDGKEEIYYPNGKIWEEKNYKKDKLDGKVTLK